MAQNELFFGFWGYSCFRVAKQYQGIDMVQAGLVACSNNMTKV
jgi:hypothetical protein